MVKYFPTYVLKKINSIHETESSGIYSLKSFDNKGNIIFDRKECVLPQNITPNYGKVEMDKMNITKEFQEYINEFCDYVHEKEASIVFSFPPIIDERFYGTDEQIEKFEQEIDNKLKATRISNIKDYVFQRDCMYDMIYHCNNKGERVRSERLAEDIIKFLNEKE